MKLQMLYLAETEDQLGTLMVKKKKMYRSLGNKMSQAFGTN